MKRLLTIDEANNGIYIDFEGRTGAAPVLLGVLVHSDDGTDEFEQIVLEPCFAPAAAARGMRVEPIATVIERLVTRAEADDIPLIGWSMHEVDVVRDHCPGLLADRFAERYVDAKATAKAARRALSLPLAPARGRERTHALGRYVRALGSRVPFPFGTGWTGITIRKLDESLARGDDWPALPPRRRMRWAFLLGHNRKDCEGTREVARWATRVLEDNGDLSEAA